MPYCHTIRTRILGWSRKIRLPGLHRDKSDTSAIHGGWVMPQEPMAFFSSVADAEHAQLENGAFWNSARGRFTFFDTSSAENSPVPNLAPRSGSVSEAHEINPNQRDIVSETEIDQASHSTSRFHARYESHHPHPSARFPSASSAPLHALHTSAGQTRNTTRPGVTPNSEVGDDTNSEIDDESPIEDNRPALGEMMQASPNAAKYLFELRPVAIGNLEDDCLTCGICQEAYDTGDEPEQPYIVGQCGHILGGTCLSRWIVPGGGEQNRSCPLCRAVLFEDDTPHGPDDYEFEGVNLRDFLDEDDTEDNFEAEAADLLSAIQVRHRAARARDIIGNIRRVIAGIPETGAVEHTARGQLNSSEQVLIDFRRFVRRSYWSHAENTRRAQELRSQMGQLYVLLRNDMRRAQMSIVWLEDGPPLSFLLDPAALPLLENALVSLVRIEQARVG